MIHLTMSVHHGLTTYHQHFMMKNNPDHLHYSHTKYRTSKLNQRWMIRT